MRGRLTDNNFLAGLSVRLGYVSEYACVSKDMYMKSIPVYTSSKKVSDLANMSVSEFYRRMSQRGT